MHKPISCGGFYIDTDSLVLTKVNGKPTLSVSPSVHGVKGDKGDPFTIDKIYESVEAMNNDFDNSSVPMGSFVLIEGSTEDNGKLYVKADNGFDYITNLTGAQGIKGEKGETGIGVPVGGHTGQALVKTNDNDYATHWEDIEHGLVIHATGSVSLGGSFVPTFGSNQMEDIYNTFTSGKNAIISDTNGHNHYKVLSVNGTDGQNITAKILLEDKYIVTYNNLGQVASFVPIDKGEVVVLSREYGTAPNDHGFYREWSPNLQGKVWVECGVFIKTVALTVGSKVPLPVTFEDGNFHVQVTVMEMGNYSAKAYRSDDNKSINVLVTDYYGMAKAVNICVEAKGWKKI